MAEKLKVFLVLIVIGLSDCSVQPEEHWTSLIFWVPNHSTFFGRSCLRQSHHYCLHTYERENNNRNAILPDGEHLSPLNRSAYEHMLQMNFERIIRPMWRRINFFAEFEEAGGCCATQVAKYVHYGYSKQLTPHEYYEKLVDYTEQHKRLNFLRAYFDPTVCLNFIVEVGFGTGPMNNDIGFLRQQSRLAFPPAPGVHPRLFSSENPENEITFHWFKHNIMCVSQPWICNEGANDINGDRNNDEFRKRRKLNSRRKKQQSRKYKYPSYCQG
ncbi:uncharacterized protein LOC134850910 [Symsagittifera roscoffensis]|uniref:uncharacterized protein LOC134850910 n=1 Tax=Symsagittifera roscoffensis TaxID=84072 RepID=UPI00307C5F03